MGREKCECCGEEKRLEFIENSEENIHICHDCLWKINDLKTGKYTPEQIITNETTDVVKNYIMKRAQVIKESAPDLTVSAGSESSGYTCSAASGVNVIGVIFLVVCIISAIVLFMYSVLGEWYIGIAIGAVAIVTGIFVKCLCSCIAIITENQYRELMKK